MLSARAVAVIIFRCLGVFAVLTSLFHFASYVPFLQGRPQGGAAPWGVFLPWFSGMAGGICLLLFARFLADLITRDIE